MSSRSGRGQYSPQRHAIALILVTGLPVSVSSAENGQFQMGAILADSSLFDDPNIGRPEYRVGVFNTAGVESVYLVIEGFG